MTREEAIEILKAHHMWTGEPQEIIDVRKENKAIEMAIKALSQEPTVTSTDEPMTMVYPTIVCDDAISREWLMRKATERFYTTNYFNHITAMIEEAPSVTQKSGKWIKLFLTDTRDIDGQCSECGFIHKFIDGHTAQYNFCPNCGAKMVEPQESEE